MTKPNVRFSNTKIVHAPAQNDRQITQCSVEYNLIGNYTKDPVDCMACLSRAVDVLQMNPSDVNCMTCLVNAARGLEVEVGWHLIWAGMTHAVVWEIGPGRLVVACKYRQINMKTYNNQTLWERVK